MAHRHPGLRGVHGVVFGLLYPYPILSRPPPTRTWKRRREQFGPTTAGLNVQPTTGLPTW